MKIVLSVSALAFSMFFFGIGHASIGEVSDQNMERDSFMTKDSRDTGWEDEVSENRNDFLLHNWNIREEDRENIENEGRELKEKLKDVYHRIKELKRDAEQLERLIKEQKGNNNVRPPRQLPPQQTKGCTKEYVPVCAQPQMPKCENEIYCARIMPSMRTFPNECIAEMRQAKVMYEGICEEDQSRFDPPMQDEVICTKEYAPVCGILEETCATDSGSCSSQRTFPNRCEAKTNNAKILYNGACNMGTKEVRVKRGSIKRNIYPAQWTKKIMPDFEVTKEGARELLPMLQKRMLPVEPSLEDFEQDVLVDKEEKRRLSSEYRDPLFKERELRPVSRSDRWSSIIDFLRRR